MGFAALGLSLYYISYRYNLFYVIQSKIDTKGQAYTLALEQLLTGVYIAELALIGIFGLKKAVGPLVLLVLLLIFTLMYQVLTNKYLTPLERFLPTDLAKNPDSTQETVPLLSSAEEGQSVSQIQRLGEHVHAPKPVAKHVVDPLAHFFEPHIFASYRSMKAWLEEDDSFASEDGPSYSDEDLRKAYLNPALTSSTPIIWLARDRIGATSAEISANKEAGLDSTDQSAWIDDQGKVNWDAENASRVPVWKEKVKY